MNARRASPAIRRPRCRHAIYSNNIHSKVAPFRLNMLREASISREFTPVSQNAIGMARFGTRTAKFTVGKNP
jgi:hypothetical protein